MSYMPFTLSHADQEAINMVDITIPLSKPTTAIKGIDGDFKIPFQFPPVITSDGKGMKWKETDAKLYEPIVNFDGANARKIQLKWKYVVTGAEWHPSKIKGILMRLRAYYYRTLDSIGSLNISGADEYIPLIYINRLYNIVTQSSTWRSSNLSITPSDRLVYYNRNTITPLSYEISMDLSLVTNIVFEEEPKQDINAENFPEQDWA